MIGHYETFCTLVREYPQYIISWHNYHNIMLLNTQVPKIFKEVIITL